MWSALIVIGMAPASYRRRSDGVLEIIRPSGWQRLGISVRTGAGVALLVAIGVAGVLLHVQLGIPVLMVAGCCALALLIRRTGPERRVATPQRLARPRTAHGMRR
jgi:hypothetical protein